jgi:phage terminase large subunit-like protein
MTTAAPAPAYFKGVGQRVTKFVGQNVRQTKGRWAGDPLSIEPWQQDILDELYLVDAEGSYVYKEGLIGIPRKNGKSTLMSAIALYGLLAAGDHGAEVYAAAASKDQARIVFNQAREFVETSPALMRWLRPQKNVIVSPSNRGVFRVLSSDAPLQHGLNPSLVVIDELHAHKDPELYYALTTGQLARENPLVVSITTAGYDRESICWDVYERGQALEVQGIEAMRAARFFSRWYQADPDADIDDEAEWERANPASWVKLEDLRHQRASLPEFVFRRLHLNQWTDTEEAWVSPADWDACKGEVLFNRENPCWVGVDIGLKRDARAFVWCQWHGDKLHIGHEIVTPTESKPLTAQGARGALIERTKGWSGLKEINYDPWQFTESAEMLLEMGLPMVEFDQGNARMAPASERIYELIKEHRIVHDGDPTLRAHVLAAVVAQTERGWRISKKESRNRIDAAVAMTIAADRAVLTRHERPPDRTAVFM